MDLSQLGALQNRSDSHNYLPSGTPSRVYIPAGRLRRPGLGPASGQALCLSNDFARPLSLSLILCNDLHRAVLGVLLSHLGLTFSLTLKHMRSLPPSDGYISINWFPLIFKPGLLNWQKPQPNEFHSLAS